MSLTALSLPAVALALFVGVGWASSGLALGAWLRLGRSWPRMARSAPLAAALPWLAAAMVAMAAVLPGDPHTGRRLACHCLESMPGWLHLCPVHPSSALGLAAPAALALVALLPGRVRALSALAREPLGVGGAWAPRVVDLGAPTALLHGWLRPTLVVDRGLWASLSEPERDVVMAHERGHLRRRDPLVRVLLRALLVLAPRPQADEVQRLWLEHAERAADSEASRVVGDGVAVAEVLLRCARLGAPSRAPAMSWTGGSLERRVQALIEGSVPEVPARPDLRALDLTALGALAALALVATPWLHHHLEHLLNLSL